MIVNRNFEHNDNSSIVNFNNKFYQTLEREALGDLHKTLSKMYRFIRTDVDH